nr:L,D-transpeptidase [Solemya elarraichensis gill symbiont]
MLVVLDEIVETFSISTALNGPGEQEGSECTPRGMHAVRLKIGDGCPLNTVFVGRRRTGEIYTPELGEADPQRDWILTRIIWLTGTEQGFNRGGQCDSLRRFIYIHGTPDSEPMGKPCSHGCIRMRNSDLVKLFELVDNGMPVLITE